MITMNISRAGRVILVVLGATLVAADAAVAQETEQGDRDNCICISSEGAPQEMLRSFFRTPESRAQLGVFLGDDSEEVDGHSGVVVMSVVDDGPADVAGLRDGDIITALDGRPLGDHPGQSLVDAMGDVEPGDTVAVSYYRDGRQHTANVVTDEATGFAVWSNAGDGFRLRAAPRWEFRSQPGSGGSFELARPEGLGGDFRIITPEGIMRRLSPDGLELVELNPSLGSYFGTDEGVLVTAVDDDSSLGLQPGDVILEIDGREARDAAHVRSILSSYRADEDITFRIMRQQRAREVTGHRRG